MIEKITKPSLGHVHSSGDQSNTECDKTRFHKLPYIAKYSKQVQDSCQKSVSSSKMTLTLTLFSLLLKLITISQLNIKHPIF